MGFVDAVASGFGNYATFSGRASRSEFWFWALFNFIAMIVASGADMMVFSESAFSPASSLLALGLLLPNIAVGVRRLHDIGRTGWWFLIAFTIIGGILLLIWACQKGTTGPNAYGHDPLGG